MTNNRIEICGGIATGKTTLAGLMAGVDVNIIHEDFAKNPFWEAYYKNPGAQYMFETETTFILQHYHDIKRQVGKEKIVIADYSFITDLAYARIGLDGTKLEVFRSIYQLLKEEIGSPALVVHLRCNAAVQASRIAARGREEENMIDLGFLEKLNQAIVDEISELSPDLKIININTESEDFAHNDIIREKWHNHIHSEVHRFSSM